MRSLTKVQRAEREAEVKAMLSEGASITDIAKRYDITQQAAAKFLSVRGLKTAEAMRRSGLTATDTTEEDRRREERKARRKAMKETVDRS